MLDRCAIPIPQERGTYLGLQTFVKLVSNHFCSTTNAYLQDGLILSDSVSIDYRDTEKSWRTEGIVVWQQLMPLQLLLIFISLFLLSQTDMRPQRTALSASINEAKLLQPMAMNLFLDWEKT